MSTVIAAPPAVAPAARPDSTWSSTQVWGVLFLLPYLVLFALFVVFPVTYGFWLARDPGIYVRLYEDPIFLRTLANTLVFIVVAVNIKLALALALSGFFAVERWWIKALAVIFILPWAVPSIPTILSMRFMMNPEWGVINTTIFRLTFQDGPNWLNEPAIALAMSMWRISGKACRSGRSSCLRDALPSRRICMRRPRSMGRRAGSASPT